MSYRLTEQLDTISSVTVDNKLITVDGVTTFDANETELKNIKRWFGVEEVSEDAKPVETKTEPVNVLAPQSADEKVDSVAKDGNTNPTVSVQRFAK